MNRVRLVAIAALLVCLASTRGAAQDSPESNQAQVGIVVPITLTGDALYTHRARLDYSSADPFTVGFRALAMPQLKIGEHWYAYGALQVRSTPFFYQDTFTADRSVVADFLQGFVGYTRSQGKATWGVKLGKLSTAFGSFPLRYDDTVDPLLDQPLTYYPLGLRADQLPCGVSDFSPLPEFEFHCGGAEGEMYGVQPATLYGLPGAEFDLSWSRLDARVQITDSSPANPRGLFSSSQHPQWTAGGGFTIQQGFRVGVSAYRGPWLDNAVKPSLPQGSNVTDFSAAGLGVDVQWARGPWSATGEWDRFVFHYPNFVVTPASNFAYLELKRIISPRWYAAFRANFEANNHPQDAQQASTSPFLPSRQAYEIAVGFRPNRFQLLKLGYEWMRMSSGPQTHGDVIGLQLVTSFNNLSKALR